MGGADLTGATIIGTDFAGADVTSTRLIAPVGLEAAKNLDQARNLQRLLKD